MKTTEYTRPRAEEQRRRIEDLKKKLESTADVQERRNLQKQILDLKIEIVKYLTPHKR